MKRELNVEIKGDNTHYKKKIDESKKETKDFANEASKVKFDVAKPEEINKVKERLKLLKEEQQDLAELIKRRSEAHSIKDIDEYNARIAETTARINTLQSVTSDNFNTFTRGVRAASSSIAGLTGAISLLGGSEEQRAKLMRVTISLMAIGNAAHRIAMLQQRSNLVSLIKVKYDNIKATLTSALSIKTEAAAVTASTSAKKGAAVTTGILTKATWLWNKAIAANPIFFILAVIIAVIGGLYALSKALGDNSKEAKGYEKTLDGVVVKDKELREAHDAHIVKLRKMQNEWDLLTGKIGEYEKTLRDMAVDNEVRLKKIKDDTEKELEEASSFWGTFWETINTKGSILKTQEVTIKRRVEAAKKGNEILAMTEKDINDELRLMSEQYRQKELQAMKEHAVETAKTKKQELDAQIALAEHHYRIEFDKYKEASEQQRLATAKHQNRIKELTTAYNNELLRIKEDRLKKELEIQKEQQDFMFAESVAYWKRELITAEQEGKTLMDAKLSLLDAETEQKLSKVAKGSEQELLILKQAEIDKGKIMREGFKYQIDMYDQMNSEMAKRLAITKELHMVYGDTYDILGDQIRIYENEIQRLIEDGYTAEDAAITKLIDKLGELSHAREKAIDDAARVAKSQQQLQAVTTDLATTFGSAMGAMARDGREASNELIKQALATAMAFVINQIIQEVEWPYNLIAAAGGAAITYALFDQVPALAQGGLAMSPTLAMVGDNPNARVDPEVIAPLSKLKGMIGDTGSENDMSKVVFEIRGDTLIGILEKYNTYQERYK